jgi:hypothetical protein
MMHVSRGGVLVGSFSLLFSSLESQPRAAKRGRMCAKNKAIKNKKDSIKMKTT